MVLVPSFSAPFLAPDSWDADLFQSSRGDARVCACGDTETARRAPPTTDPDRSVTDSPSDPPTPFETRSGSEESSPYGVRFLLPGKRPPGRSLAGTGGLGAPSPLPRRVPDVIAGSGCARSLTSARVRRQWGPGAGPGSASRSKRVLSPRPSCFFLFLKI